MSYYMTLIILISTTPFTHHLGWYHTVHQMVPVWVSSQSLPVLWLYHMHIPCLSISHHRRGVGCLRISQDNLLHQSERGSSGQACEFGKVHPRAAYYDQITHNSHLSWFCVKPHCVSGSSHVGFPWLRWRSQTVTVYWSWAMTRTLSWEIL